MTTNLPETLDHIEIRTTGHNGRWAVYTVFVIDGAGRITDSRQFTNPERANAWADSWGFPRRLVDGWL